MKRFGLLGVIVLVTIMIYGVMVLKDSLSTLTIEVTYDGQVQTIKCNKYDKIRTYFPQVDEEKYEIVLTNGSHVDYSFRTCDEIKNMKNLEFVEKQVRAQVTIYDINDNILFDELVSTTTKIDSLKTMRIDGDFYFDKERRDPVKEYDIVYEDIALYSDQYLKHYVTITRLNGRTAITNWVNHEQDIFEVFEGMEGTLFLSKDNNSNPFSGPVTSDLNLYYRNDYTVDNRKIGIVLTSDYKELENAIVETFTDHLETDNIEVYTKVSDAYNSGIYEDVYFLVNTEQVSTLLVVLDTDTPVTRILEIAGDTEVIFVSPVHVTNMYQYGNLGSKFLIDASNKEYLREMMVKITSDFDDDVFTDINYNNRIDYVAMDHSGGYRELWNSAWGMRLQFSNNDMDADHRLLLAQNKFTTLNRLLDNEDLLHFIKIGYFDEVDVFITTSPQQTELFVNMMYENDIDVTIYGIVDDTIDIADLENKGLDSYVKIDYDVLSNVVYQATMNVIEQRDFEFNTGYWFFQFEGLLQYNYRNLEFYGVIEE